MQTSRNVRTIPAIHGSSDHVVFRRGPAGIAIQAEAREDEWASVAVGPFDLDEMRTVLDHLAATPEETLGAYQRHEKHDAADFEHAHFAMHPVTGSVASKGRMDWKWVLPGWYNTGDVSRLSDQQMADAGWSPVRECPDPDEHVRYDAALADAEKAEQERDEALRTVQEVVDSHDETPREIASGKYVTESRPLTPDAITDEMVKRAHAAAAGFGTAADISASATFAMLTAALTEPPARPEGAEEIDEHLRQANSAALGGALTPEQRRALADHLAGFGYRNPLDRAEDGAA